MEKNKFILEYLYKNNIVDSYNYEQCLTMCNKLNFEVENYLLDKKIISKQQYLDSLSNYYDMPMVDFDSISINLNLEEYFSLELLKKYNFVPVFNFKDKLVIATSNPFNSNLKSIISSLYAKPYLFILTESDKIKTYLASYLANKYTKNALSSIINTKSESSNKDFEQMNVQDAPAIKFVDSIIKQAIPLRASDIHVEPRELQVVIRYRIDGDLIKKAEFPIEYFPEICARIKILANMDIAERRIPQDGRISMNINDEEYDFRVSTLPTIHGEKFVIRILDNKIFSYSRKELNFSDESNALIEKIIKNPHGIILLTGPTGCGKTTTLYALIRELNKESKNLVTIEDPVEYSVDGINQIQINNKANVTFASSLRSILRQDPDVIMVGEIRDDETAQIAIRAAITGHLVLSTLHTNNAPGAVIRLLDMGVPAYLVSDALVAVISQRLVKKLCPNCAVKTETTKHEMKALGIKKPAYIYKACGCNYCNNTGYKGRVAIHEIMYLDKELKNLISSEDIDLEVLKQKAVEDGMKTLAQAGADYVLAGITSFEELMSILLSDE